jgi:hypothetical protein
MILGLVTYQYFKITENQIYLCYTTYNPQNLIPKQLNFIIKKMFITLHQMSCVVCTDINLQFLGCYYFGIKTGWIFGSVWVMQGSLAYNPHLWASYISTRDSASACSSRDARNGRDSHFARVKSWHSKQNNKIQFHTQAIKLFASVSTQSFQFSVCDKVNLSSAHNMRSVPFTIARLNASISRRNF